MRTVPPRLLLVVALLLTALGAAAAALEDDGEPPLELATGGDVRGAADDASPLRAGQAPSSTSTTEATSRSTSTSSATAAPRRSTLETTSRPTASTSPTSTAAPGPTTSTTIDWRAAGLPGPVGSTIEPWSIAPYRVAEEGLRSTLSMEAPRNGAHPGTTMPVTVHATFSPYTAGGSIVLIGPLDPSKPYDDQPRQVLDTWSGACDVITGATTQRSATVTLPMEVIRKPEYTLNDLQYELYTYPTTCEGTTFPDTWFHFSFWVADPYVVAPPGPSLGSTG